MTVATPVVREVVRFEQFTGRAEAIDKVDIRARVSGFLTKVHFTPGTEVAAGAPLFDVDSAPFEAEYAVTAAQVAVAEARLLQMSAELARVESVGPAAAAKELDRARANKKEAEAAVKAAKAQADLAKLNVGYCKLSAPIAGMIGDHLSTAGNLITGGQGQATLLATIVSVDPIAVAFELDENTLQRIQREVRENKVRLTKDGEIPAEAGLAVDGTAYPLRGKVTFFNNKVDPKTGTLKVKAEFPNPKADRGGRPLAPGMFVRVRIPLGDPKSATLVPEAALQSDQADKYLYAVGADNKAVRLNADLGAQQGEQRVILSVRAVGEKDWRPLSPDERVVVGGMQRVRPGMTVEPKTQAAK